jgi:excisionase family DNA binding protein
MNLSLAEAAQLLGKSERQLRYLIQKGELPARKKGNRWVLERQDLPLTEGQQHASEHKARRARKTAKSGKRLSVDQLRVCEVGLPLFHELQEAVGIEHPAVPLLRESLMLLACGYYEYEGLEKGQYYSQAREQASRAAMALLLEDREPRRDFLERFEVDLIPAIGGLIRKVGSWSRQ